MCVKDSDSCIPKNFCLLLHLAFSTIQKIRALKPMIHIRFHIVLTKPEVIGMRSQHRSSESPSSSCPSRMCEVDEGDRRDSSECPSPSLHHVHVDLRFDRNAEPICSKPHLTQVSPSLFVRIFPVISFHVVLSDRV